MTNLLDNFALAHTQLTRLSADLTEIVNQDQTFNTKVELKLTPREMAAEGDLPQYQVTARLVCRGNKEAETTDQPLFSIELIMQAVYRQMSGDPISFEEFSQNHASLTRQIYPLIHHQIQPVMKQLGLDQLRLPFDLANGDSTGEEPDSVRQVH